MYNIEENDKITVSLITVQTANKLPAKVYIPECYRNVGEYFDIICNICKEYDIDNPTISYQGNTCISDPNDIVPLDQDKIEDSILGQLSITKKIKGKH